MDKATAIKKIKEYEWDFRVSRTGFFQSKAIVHSAIVENTITLTGDISAHYANLAWVNECNLYDEKATREEFYPAFEEAFAADADWPLAIVKYYRAITPEKDALVKRLHANWSDAARHEKISALQAYEKLLRRVQKHYTVAFSLTKWCEARIREVDETLLQYAVSYDPLDVERHTHSLISIQKSGNDEESINAHIKKFAWIKTAYNIIDDYTQEEVMEELSTELHIVAKEDVPEHPYRHLIVGAQVGIFTRNRMKELSQQIWFAVENLGQDIADSLDISRDDFFQLTVEEVIASLNAGALSVSRDVIQARHQGFVLAYLDDEEVWFTGPEVSELHTLFTEVDVDDVTEITGNTACKGDVTGTVRIVKNQADFDKLQEGDILVTPMTTPDFVVVMKKASAIVTDEGGLSCHAAIVSRELDIACVIGTKFATKALRDGDSVRVDATNGKVTILASSDAN